MAPSSGTDNYTTYFDNEKLSDLTIRLGDRCVFVHRIVLCRHLAYFEKLLTHHWLQGKRPQSAILAVSSLTLPTGIRRERDRAARR